MKRKKSIKTLRPEEKQEAILTIDDKARPVDDRLGNPMVGRQMYSKYRQALLTVAQADARVMAIHRGEAPYKDAELRGLGQGGGATLTPGK